jgi:hypothetical protein
MVSLLGRGVYALWWMSCVVPKRHRSQLPRCRLGRRSIAFGFSERAIAGTTALANWMQYLQVVSFCGNLSGVFCLR